MISQTIKDIIGMYILTLKAAADPGYKKIEYLQALRNLFIEEIDEQQELIEDTKVWLKDLLKPLFDRFHVTIAKVQRSKQHLYLSISGDRATIKMLQDILPLNGFIGLNVDEVFTFYGNAYPEIKSFLDHRLDTLVARHKRAGARFMSRNETVIDALTGLMWTRKTLGRMTYSKAKVQAAALTTGGFTDWRVPTVAELQTLVRRGSSPSIDIEAFPDTEAADYFAIPSSTYPQAVNFKKYGITGEVSQNVACYMRLVREV